MPNEKTVPVRHLPSTGLNVYEDETNIDPKVMTQAENVYIDKRNIVVRKGIERSTYGGATTGQATDTINSAIRATYDDSTANTFIVDEGGGTPTLEVWDNSAGRDDRWATTVMPIPYPATLVTAERGDFIQYKNNVYYTAKSTTPLKIPKSTVDTNEYQKSVGLAGTPSPDTIKMLAAWEGDDMTKWSKSGNGTAAAAETNSTLYTYGEGGVTLSTYEDPAAEGTTTYTYTDTISGLDKFWTSGYNSANTDLVAFYLCRHEAIRIKTVTIKIMVDDSNYYECLVGGTIEDTDEDGNINPLAVMKNFNPTGSVLSQWSNDFSNFKNFLVRLRKSWFIATNPGDPMTWASTFTKIQIALTSSVKATSTHPAAITLNYLHLRSSYPTPVLDGAYICEFDGLKTWTGTGVARSWEYVSQGVTSLELTLNPSQTNGEVTATLGTQEIDVKNLGNGSELSERDHISIVLGATTTKRVRAIRVTITLTDADGGVAIIREWIGDPANASTGGIFHPRQNTIGTTLTDGTGAHMKRCTHWLIGHAGEVAGDIATGLIYGGNLDTPQGTATKFSEFDWGNIKTITIAAYSNGYKARYDINGVITKVYIDEFKVSRGKYKKAISNFMPGVVDYLANTDSAVSTMLSDFPIFASTVNAVMDFAQHKKWMASGNGSFQMPYFQHAERAGLSAASLLINAGFGEDYDIIAGLNQIKHETSGFRVMFTFPTTKPLDLSTYKKRWRQIAKGVNDLDSNMPIMDGDRMRCWTWISDPNKLDRIIFRLYTEADESGGWYTFSRFDNDPSDNPEYFEYIWDASKLHNAAAAAAKQNQKLADSYEENSILHFIENSSQDDLAKMAENAPEWVQLAAGLTGITGDNYDELDKLLGLPSNLLGKDPGKKTDEGWIEIIKWNRGDMVYKSGSDTDISWASIKGYSIEVIPKSGETVSVAFDNWYIEKKGHLNGNYWYCTTFTDNQGQESKPSQASDMISVDSSDVYVTNLPTTWPATIDYMTIYRMGGTRPDWYEVGKVASSTISSFIDDVDDENVGAMLSEAGEMPPMAKYLSLSNDRMIYANIVDRFTRSHPSRIYISEPFTPGIVSPTMIRDFSPSDGTEITGLSSFAGYDIVFKNKSIYTMTGPDYLPLKRSNYLGCIARRSIAVHEKYVLFLSHDGPAAFNISEASAEIGRAVRTKTDAYTPAQNANAVGFIHENYYYLFYGTNNDLCLILHLPTGTWVEAKFKISSTLYAQATDHMKDDSTGKVYLATAAQAGTNTYDNSVLDFLTAQTDCGETITGTIQFVDTDLGAGENQKNLKAIYFRSKILNGTPTILFTPYFDEAQISSAGTAFTMPASAYTVASSTINTTKILVPNLATGAFTYGLKVTISGRANISLLTSLLDILPMRNQ